ncbi:hypothetical protein I350_01409 [Cryptococcus amylolentus CBS 6273]|uniref:F-box domain-containing protein n=1 Tax=Cryptococcus amylolentus CBS 6273 TaxID=1296118 RepID=A0A1E3KCH7_9TREE|nr:hypothetical protein I350_01409 [Cryptococcus amylolentus CBS 6273]
MLTLKDIPSEVILEHLLPVLPLRDIASLSAVSHFFRNVSRDPAFWRLKSTSDFSFSPASHPPAPSPDWWRRVYLGLLNPRAYVWGTSTNGRLGGAENGQGVRGNGPHVCEPAEIAWDRTLQQVTGGDSLATDPSSKDGPKVPGVVELQAAGWSFTARCSDGSVWVWGQMDGTGFAFRPFGWENKHAIIRSPTLVPLPCKAEAISTGRCHLLVLDADNLIWELCSWGRAYHHTAPALTAPVNHGSNSHPPHIVQLSAGWQHSAALSSKGTIHVWYPFTPAYRESLTAEDDLNGPIKPPNNDGGDDDDDDDERALRWGKVGPDVVHELPSIPDRPGLDEEDDKRLEYRGRDRGGHTSQELRALWSEYESTTSRNSQDDQRVVKLASGADFLLALKANGEVWHISLKQDQPSRWRYLPYFSSPSITHITAQFQSITSYAIPTFTSGTSALCHTRLEDDVPVSENPDILLHRPDALPALQDKQIIQVASGDYHYAALTSKGEMYTWGKGNNGQLGLGDLGGKGEEVPPTKVEFDRDEDDDDDEGVFVFAITAAGWHTGALVLGDLDSTKSQRAKKVNTSDEKAAKAAEHGPSTDVWRGPEIRHLPLPRGRAGFRGRIGYAGRGLFHGIRGGHAPAAGGGHGIAGQEESQAGGGEASSGQHSSGGAEETTGEGSQQVAGTSAGGVEGQESQQTSSNNHPLQQPSHHGLRGLPHFRVGFAGRPGNLARGGGANNNGVGFNPDGPE